MLCSSLTLSNTTLPIRTTLFPIMWYIYIQIWFPQSMDHPCKTFIKCPLSCLMHDFASVCHGDCSQQERWHIALNYWLTLGHRFACLSSCKARSPLVQVILDIVLPILCKSNHILFFPPGFSVLGTYNRYSILSHCPWVVPRSLSKLPCSPGSNTLDAADWGVCRCLLSETPEESCFLAVA